MYYYSLHSSLSVHVFAQDVTIDGLGYSLLSDGTAYVSTFQDATLTGAITIPSSITSDTTTYQVIALGNNCFDSCTKITSVKLPVGIKYLGDRCFYGCSALESCNISNTVIEIGNGCFVKYIDHAFRGGINLEKIICHWTSLRANVTFLTNSQMGKKESLEDTANVLGRLYDGIEYRGFEQSVVEDLAKYSGVPVWNGLTDIDHPTQVLADFLTAEEHLGKSLDQMKLCYVGDGRNNVANALFIGATKVGMDFAIATPSS